MTHTLITGGAKSGKSSFAEELLAGEAEVCYIATSVMNYADQEMAARIRKHQARRPSTWTTHEQFLALDQLIYQSHQKFTYYLLDCVTIWNTNYFYYLMTEEFAIPLEQVDQAFERFSEEERQVIEDRIFLEWQKIIQAIQATQAKVILVTNEVGSGVVPVHFLGRWFQDLLGKVNQMLGKEAESVYFVVCGIPQKIK